MKKPSGIILFTGLIITLILLRFFLIKSNQNTDLSFYYWKSNFELSHTERELLNTLECTKLYLHLFDVNLAPGTKEAVPQAQIRMKDSVPENMEIVPVIYITQACFNEVSDSKLKNLAKNIVALSEKILNTRAVSWKEFQIDCDWTAGNKQAYFNFLENLKQELPTECLLSATIRLHQIKYSERTGIPPVDKGVLMFYNMGEVKIFDNRNSIYDSGIAGKYLSRIKTYNLPLDYALPAFGWGLHYRMKKLQKIMQPEDLNAIKASNHFHSKGNNNYYCTESGYCGNQYFQEGDLIEIERVNFELSYKAARQLNEFSGSGNRTLIFYHLGSSEIQQYETNEFEAFRSLFN